MVSAMILTIPKILNIPKEETRALIASIYLPPEGVKSSHLMSFPVITGDAGTMDATAPTSRVQLQAPANSLPTARQRAGQEWGSSGATERKETNHYERPSRTSQNSK
jgi:hypothetical protein